MVKFAEVANLITLGQRCDEHQICLIMVASTAKSGVMSNLYRLGRAISYFTTWDRFTSLVLQLSEVKPESVIYALPPAENLAANVQRLKFTALRYAELPRDWSHVNEASEPLLWHAGQVLTYANGRLPQLPLADVGTVNL